MTTQDRLKQLFDAAMEASPETPAKPSRAVALPRNPNGSQSGATAVGGDVEDVDPVVVREEMLQRVNRLKAFLAK